VTDRPPRHRLPRLGASLVLPSLLLVGLAGPARAQTAAAPAPGGSAAADCAAAVVSTMSEPQRVGQLFTAGVDASRPTREQLAMVSDRHLGGVILTGRSSAGTAATRAVTDDLRARSGGATTAGVGLWVSTDQEGGAVQVLSGPGFSDIPTALRQGSLPPAELRARAAGWGRELRAAGVDLDLAPVLDTVPADLGNANAPIGHFDREFAHDPGGVSASGTAFAAGMADAGVQTTAKHFPGLGRVLGNTDTTAGVTDDTTVRGDAYLRPFADAVAAGVPVVMVSSARYSRIDDRSIATFSPTVVRDLLRGDLGFRGVVMSDSLGATALDATPVADRAVRFIEAGGTVALSAESGIVGPMVDGVLARERADASFRALVDDAARTVVATKAAAGLVPCPAGTAAVAARWTELGGASSVLGPPVDAAHPVPGGTQQDFRSGAILASPTTGAHVLLGAVLAHDLQLGLPEALGFPTTDELSTPDGVGRFNHFAGDGGASIYWTPATGAWSVHGAIQATWAALGWERGPVGYPVTDELPTPDGVGRFNHFTSADGGASIYWTPATGAWPVHGAIRVTWADLGWERSALGYPTSGELATSTGVVQHFQGGDVTWTRADGSVRVTPRP